MLKIYFMENIGSNTNFVECSGYDSGCSPYQWSFFKNFWVSFRNYIYVYLRIQWDGSNHC